MPAKPTAGSICSFAVLALAAASGCEGTTEAPKIGRDDVSCRLGVAGAIDERAWNVLRIKVRNQGGDFKGTLEVRGTAGQRGELDPEPVVYRMSLDVPGKSTTTKEVSFPVRPERWHEVLVTLSQPGFSRELRFDLPEPAASEEEEARWIRVLAIGNPAPELSSVASFVAREAKTKLDRVKVTRVPSKDLSSCAAAYDPFALVVLCGTALTDAPAGAFDALSRWVESGGTLAVFPGPEWASGLPEPLWKLLGVRAAGDQATPEDLAARIGPAAKTGLYRSLTPLEGTTDIAEGIAFASTHGAGSVTTFSFGPVGESFPSKANLPGVFAALKTAVDRALSFAGNARRDINVLESEAENSLLKMAAFRVPDRSSVVYGLALYLALGFFLPAIIFRALKRPEWTYAAVIAASAAFTIAIYRFGLLSTLESAELCEITILRVHDDGKAAEATSFIGLMSPVAERVVLWAGPADGSGGAGDPLATALPQPLVPGKGERRFLSSELFSDQQVIHVDRAGRLRLGEVALLPNEIRSFRYDYKTDAPSLVDSPVATLPLRILVPEAAELASTLEGKLRADTDARGLPDFDVAAVRAPVFPGGERIPERKAITLIVRERRAERAK